MGQARRYGLNELLLGSGGELLARIHGLALQRGAHLALGLERHLLRLVGLLLLRLGLGLGLLGDDREVRGDGWP